VVKHMVLVAALALSSLGCVCAKIRERPGATAGQSAVGEATHDTGPWVRVAGSPRRDELDTATIVRSDSNVYEGWFRRPMPSAQGARESYHVRYEIDCLAGIVRATQAAIYSDSGALTKALSPSEIVHSGEARWSGPISRDLAAVFGAICGRVRGANLPIAKP